LAHQVSQKTQRVVLSWHNATLAAAGGWAFEALSEQFPSLPLWQAFAEKIETQTAVANSESYPCRESLDRLWRLWENRLFSPKLLHVFWESRIRAVLDPFTWKKEWENDLEVARLYLQSDAVAEVLRGDKYGWHGAVSPNQRIDKKHLLAWHKHRQTLWHQGLLRLVALVREGQRLMNSGQLRSFVLPWIDKFFISSRREEDLDYFPSIVQWLERQGLDPLILFWEDTSHAEIPSFQLALRRLRQKGYLYRGIGIYDDKWSDRLEAEKIISEEHPQIRLFALRPFKDTHYSRSLHQLLGELDYGIFRAYDSSWKDNLCFIYAGTQVFPFLSVQCEMETFSPWVAVEHRRIPFGLYLRGRLREKVLGPDGLRMFEDTVSHDYAIWANLC
jgi:hypothetical protein